MFPIVNLTFGQDGDALLGADGHTFGEATRSGEQNEGAAILPVFGLLYAEDYLAGLWVPERSSTTDQRRPLGNLGNQAGCQRDSDTLSWCGRIPD